jgi:hypothetical protein
MTTLLGFHSSSLFFRFCETTHADTKSVLAWTPADFTLGGQEVAQALVDEACLFDPLLGLKHIMLAAYQKDEARKTAFRTWGHEHTRGQHDRKNGTKPCSFAFTHTLTKPPDGGSHPLWQAATAREKDTQFTQRTTSTAIQAAVDHAFTGTYVTRFRPTDPPEARACPCGPSLTHIPPHHSYLPRYNAERCAANILFITNPVAFRVEDQEASSAPADLLTGKPRCRVPNPTPEPTSHPSPTRRGHGHVGPCTSP